MNTRSNYPKDKIVHFNATSIPTPIPYADLFSQHRLNIISPNRSNPLKRENFRNLQDLAFAFGFTWSQNSTTHLSYLPRLVQLEAHNFRLYTSSIPKPPKLPHTIPFNDPNLVSWLQRFKRPGFKPTVIWPAGNPNSPDSRNPSFPESALTIDAYLLL